MKKETVSDEQFKECCEKLYLATHSEDKKSSDSAISDFKSLSEMSKSADFEHTSGVPKIMTAQEIWNDMEVFQSFSDKSKHEPNTKFIPLSEVEKLREEIMKIIQQDMCCYLGHEGAGERIKSKFDSILQGRDRK